MRTITLSYIKTGMLDVLILLLVYLLPSLWHMVAFPVYYLEPMRIGVLTGIIYSNRSNVYLLAFTLPLFSYITSGHPVFIKTLLISAELMLNAWLFYVLDTKYQKLFLAILLSLILSKLTYYLLKFILLSLLLLEGGLISTPIHIQVVSVIWYSMVFYIFIKLERYGRN